MKKDLFSVILILSLGLVMMSSLALANNEIIRTERGGNLENEVEEEVLIVSAVWEEIRNSNPLLIIITSSLAILAIIGIKEWAGHKSKKRNSNE